MIKSFKDKETQKIFEEKVSKKIPSNIQRVALRKLRMIDSSSTLEDLKSPPNNRLEPLQGDRKGQYSIRVNEKYRICFIYKDGDFIDIEIVDYH